MNNGVKSRLLAFDVLDAVNRDGAYANLAIAKILENSNLSTQDKAFVTELAFGSIRLQAKYDFAISQFADRALSEIDPKLLDLLRIGAHQIFSMRTPAHAAINETVEVGKKVVGKSRSSFLNAMLRKLLSIEDLDNLIKTKILDNEEKLSILYSHPLWIIRAFFDRLGSWNEVEELLRADNVPAKPNLIAWPNLSDTDELISHGGAKIDFVSNGVEASNPPDSYLAVRERRAGVQDAGSQYVTEIVYATHNNSDEVWLDMCAAPGGKAKYLYELLAHKNFYANELNSARFGLLKQVLPTQNLLNLDGRNPDDFPTKFDRILIDAPCTGLGALRRRPEARWRKSINDLKELIKIQRELIDSAYELLNTGGILAYATCSPHLLETQAQVADALHRHKGLELIPIGETLIKTPLGIEANGTMQLWTHRNGTDSMFLALFRKK